LTSPLNRRADSHAFALVSYFWFFCRHSLTRIIESQLYGIKPHDSISLLAACASVTLVAILAASLPACRATRIDPVQALRYE
jgi:ABC-type lipoprotein release transport system permease subunit